MGKDDGRGRASGEDLLRLLMESLPDAVYFKDLDSRFTRTNRTHADWLGLADPAEAVGKRDADFFRGDFARRAFEAEQRIIHTGEPLIDVEERCLWPDGREMWVATTKLPLRDAEGRIVGTFGLSRDIGAHKRSESQLRDSEALYHSLVEHLPQNVFRKDLEGRLTFGNQKFCQTLGKPLGELLGRTDFDLFPPDLARKYRDDDLRVIKTGRVYETVEEHLPPGKTDRIYVRVIKAPLFDSKGYITGVQGLFWDVTELTRAQKALETSQERYALAVEGAKDGLWDWDFRANTVYFAARWKSMLGHEDHEIGGDPEEWLSRVHPDDRSRVKAEIAAHVQGGSAHFESEHRMRHKDGTYLWMLSRAIAVRAPGGKATRMAGSQTDITDRKRVEEQLARQAFYDTLTGLPNRALFMDRLDQAIRRARRRSDVLFAALFLDVDRFKDVNDSLGHLKGDALLAAVARRLESCVRPGDTVARLGGDEFTILLDDMRAPDDAVQVAQRIQQQLAQPFAIEGKEIFASASIGIAPGGGYERAEDLLRDADTAMYRAKERGRACYEVFDQAMHARAVRRLELETDLRRAIERNEFRVFYQPIVSLKDDRLSGFEALVRWQHPQRGLLGPGEFLPLAEENGLILPIDLLVLREACRQTRLWQERYAPNPALRISVNLSTRQFARPDLVERVSAILQETGFDGRNLSLEITESVLIEDSASIPELLRRLRELHVQFSLDDFGTGYSSLGYLHRFPIDYLKIHHSFVGALGRPGSQGQLVRTITTLAGNLGMGVVAEGVETPEQLAHLRDLQCDRVQGFYFSKPVAPPAAELLVAKGLSWQAA
jgi:diguanylate cyclase (GGDEF)-like protein/PAS domain S-box-containing protein